MSKENQNRNGGSDTQGETKDSDGNQPKEQDGGNDSGDDRFKDMSKDELIEKAKELEGLIVSKKKAEKSKNSNDNSDGDGDSKSKTDTSGGEDKYLTKEEAKLINSEDLDFDDLDVLRKVQKGEGVNSLEEAKDSDLFQAYKERKKREQKSKEASLGASQGGSAKGDSGFEQGMSEEEHKEKFREYNQNQ